MKKFQKYSSDSSFEVPKWMGWETTAETLLLSSNNKIQLYICTTTILHGDQSKYNQWWTNIIRIGHCIRSFCSLLTTLFAPSYFPLSRISSKFQLSNVVNCTLDSAISGTLFRSSFFPFIGQLLSSYSITVSEVLRLRFMTYSLVLLTHICFLFLDTGKVQESFCDFEQWAGKSL